MRNVYHRFDAAVLRELEIEIEALLRIRRRPATMRITAHEFSHRE
jgi:hypothetical protein